MQPRPPAEIEKPPPPAPSKGNGAKVLVTRFTFSGNTVIPTNELEKIVAPYIGKELTVRELKDVAGRISEHYLANGYLLGQAYLPPQEMLDDLRHVRHESSERSLRSGDLPTQILQSNPVRGVAPPQAYGVPRKWRAYATTWSPNACAAWAG